MRVVNMSYKDPENEEWIHSLREMHPRDVAESLSVIPFRKVRDVLRKLDDEFAAEVIAECSIELKIWLFESMRLQRVSGIVGEMFSDDAADILGHVSGKRLEEIMSSLSPKDAMEISELLQYPEDSAGGIMQTEYVVVREEQTIEEAIKMLRRGEDEVGREGDDMDDAKRGLFYIYVVDDHEKLKGVLNVRDLVFNKLSKKIKDVMVPEVRCVSVHADQEEIVKLFQHYHHMVVPVVDDFQRLRGVVTMDDALQVMEDEATEDMQRMIGLSGEEVLETPWLESVKNRLPWLYVNLATAFLAGWVVSLFEGTIEKCAVLAVFLPIIAGQAGNSGTQTLTILVRSLALGDVKFGQQWKIFLKEFLVGLMTGLGVGIVVGFVSWLWKGSYILGVITFLAMVLNMLAAAISGVLIPLSLKALKIDPALASAIILTTVTDVMGFFIFLGLATIALHHMVVF